MPVTVPVEKDLHKSLLEGDLHLLYQMLLIRRFEERASQAYQQQKIGGFCHLYIGQEAVAVGAVAAARRDDYIITAYRDHGHAIARGASLNACMAELLGKATGISKGLGGSMAAATTAPAGGRVQPRAPPRRPGPPARGWRVRSSGNPARWRPGQMG